MSGKTEEVETPMSYNGTYNDEQEQLLPIQVRESPEGSSAEVTAFQDRETTGSPHVDIDILTQSGSHIVIKSENISEVDLSTRTTNSLCNRKSLFTTTDVIDHQVISTTDRSMTLSVIISGTYKDEKPECEYDYGCSIHLIRNTECLMHLLKGMIGTGILAMPVAYKNGGLWVSFATVLLIGAICTHCMHQLVKAGNKLSERTGISHLDYASVMEKAFETRTDSLQKYSKAGKNFVNLFLIITQFGFCCVYTVFVAQNLQQVAEYKGTFSLNSKLYVTMVSALLIPYVMIKSLKALAPFSAFANLLNSVGLVIILVNLFQEFPHYSARPAFGSLATLPLFFGQAIFSFEGIGLVLPLHNKMKEPQAFLGKAGVLNLGLTITIALYNTVGFYGYLKYGDDAKGSVTLNLPSDQWLYLSVKLMFALSLFISYGLQFYVPINIVWPFILRKTKQKGMEVPNYMEYVFRFLIVVFTCGLSTLIPHLDLLISLVGAFASSFLALMFPPMIELLTFECGVLTWCKNIFIFLLGLVGFLTGTYSSMKEIINTF